MTMTATSLSPHAFSFVNLHVADPYLLFIVGISCIVSFVRGFIREVLSLLFWAAAIWVGIQYGKDLAFLFQGMTKSPTIQMALGSLVLFVGTLFSGMIINYFLWMLIKKTGLSSTDRFLGLIFGMARGLLIATILIVLARVTPLARSSFFADSGLIPQLQPLADPIQQFLQKRLSDLLPEMQKQTGKAAEIIGIPQESKNKNSNNPTSEIDNPNKILPRSD